MSNLIGAILAGRYKVSEIIARGGMATVYKAQDEKLDRLVAIKVIHPHLSEDPLFRDKFFREARMLAKVNHSNLVNIYDQGDDKGNAFIVLELVQGITLRQALNDFGALDTAQIVQVSKAVLAALAQAHNAGIVHRDLKPENVLLADDGRIKVTDFGLARELTANTDTGSLVGTVAYLAPEVIRRGQTAVTSDVYSFGIMVFEMLTGQQPFKGEDPMQIAFRHTAERVPSAKSIKPNANAKLDELMLWCTEPDPNSRPKDASDVLSWFTANDLESSNTSATIVMPANLNFTEVISDLPEPEAPFKKHSSKFVALRWMVASLLALTLGSFGGWYFSSGPGALVAVPTLIDKTELQATTALKAITTDVSVRKVFSESFAIGTVIGTEPNAGLLVPRGSHITLLVSKGKELVSVPDLKGKDLVTASALLVSARLKVGKVTEWFNSDFPVGAVYSYTGSKETKLAVNTAVDLKISLGAIPLVTGLKEDVAKAALEAAGLQVRTIEYKFSTSVDKNYVISIVPDEQEVGKGSTLKMVVSKGPDTVKMPAVKGETILAAKSLLESLGLVVVIDTKWLTKDYGIKRVTGASESVGATLKVGQSVTIRSR